MRLTIALTVCLSVSACSSPHQTTKPSPPEEILLRKDPMDLTGAEVAELTTLANSGNSLAAFRLAKYYLSIAHNSKKGRYWLESSARGGLAVAQLSLYSLLSQSEDLKIRKGSIYWLVSAAKQGYEPAKRILTYEQERLARGEY